MSYFQRHAGSYDQGNLVYHTITPNGSQSLDTVMEGTRLEKSVLLYDSLLNPNIFLARSNDSNQVIMHFVRNGPGDWPCDTILHLHNDCGKFIYEMSATTGPDNSFHLLLLLMRSNIDSDDFMDAWMGSYLMYLTNAGGIWNAVIIHSYDMAYTYDMYVKSSSRQDIAVDDSGYVHVTFSEQLVYSLDPSQLLYATNKAGFWGIEVALEPEPRTTDDAGWYPSLCLDTAGVPYIACMYVDRVLTYSAMSCTLLLLRRDGINNWHRDTVATHSDGYYGSDGTDYTGALSHLIFDSNNTPHVIFSDVASTHYPPPDNQLLGVGNIRYGVLKDSAWNFTTLYRQPRPADFLHSTEMYGMCLLLSENSDSIRVIGEELIVYGAYQYHANLLDIAWASEPTDVDENPEQALPERFELSQNYPNPFNPGTAVRFELPRRSVVTVRVHNLLGQLVKTLVDADYPAGEHSVYWDGKDDLGRPVASGVYFCRVNACEAVETKKMLLIR